MKLTKTIYTTLILFTTSIPLFSQQLRFTYATPFTDDGIAIVKINGKYGYIKTNGKWIIKPKFAFAEHFANGLARVKIRKNGKYGFIKNNGKWAIKPRYKFSKIINP